MRTVNKNKWNRGKKYSSSEFLILRKQVNLYDNKLALDLLIENKRLRTFMVLDKLKIQQYEEKIKELHEKLNKANRIINITRNITKDVKRDIMVAFKKFESSKIDRRQQNRNDNREQDHINKEWRPKYQPMTLKIYNRLINDTLLTPGSISKYKDIRLRIAFCTLFLTGITINELLALKVYQLQTLVENHWILINGSERGSANDKACLTEEGKKVINERKKDFELLFYRRIPDSYVFTSEFCTDKMLQRETITRDINKVMRDLSNQLPNYPTLTVHSFRIGDIEDLWENSKYIELVKQSLGHQTLNTTL